VSSAKALLDIIRLLNAQDFKRSSHDKEHGDECYPLDISAEVIVANYATLRLSSVFQPIVTRTFELLGHKAKLKASPHPERDYNLNISKLVRPGDQESIIYLDRLTRTLHALNYLASDLNGELHVSVNPQHLLEIQSNHGAVFEQILSKCGLQPHRIVLEISEYSISNKRHLQNAIDAWRKRRYKIAIDGVDADYAQLPRLVNLKPDIIKINGNSLRQFSTGAGVSKRLAEIIEECRSRDIDVIVTDIESAALYQFVRPHAFSALQGAWLTELSVRER
jgi:EAL domain-containing protein (putative c-di-GMP-specific phosphodiesterase class I)